MLTFVTVLAVLNVLLAVSQGDSCGRVVCYHTNWSQYRPGSGKFFPDNIDPSLCTHLIYSFAKLTGDHLAPFEWNDDSTDWSVGLYEKFNNLKQRNPSLKTLLAVGGWNLGSEPFHNIVQNSAHRQEFVTQSIKFLRDRNFDGLDLDWEYPGNRGSPPEDKQHYIEILQDLKRGFEAEAQSSGKPRLLLTAAVAAGKDVIDSGYDIPAMASEMDFVNLMSYDLHGSWEDTTGHHSALYATSQDTGDNRYLNINFAAQYWAQKGMPHGMINIGVAMYGRSFTLASASNNGVGASAPRPGQAGQFTREAGFIAYYEVCDLLKSGGQEEWINEGYVPYVHKDTQWVGYDNPKSLKEKVRYIKENQFGGVMVWSLALDDFPGTHCGQGPFPLMHAINDECKHSTGALDTPAPYHSTVAPTDSQGHTAQPVTTQQSHTIAHTDDFTCTDKDGFYASPNSCGEYYICASEISYLVRCAEGLVFNPNTGFCDWPSNYVCTLSDAPTPTPHQSGGHTTPAVKQTTRQTTQSPVHTTASSTEKVSSTSTTPPPTTTTARQTTQRTEHGSTHPHEALLDFCHDKTDGIYPDSTDCAHFVECSNGHTFRFPCAPGSIYNPDKLSCDSPSNVPACVTYVTDDHTPMEITHIHHTTQRTVTATADLSNFCSSHNDGPHANPNDCQSFIECAHGHMYVEHCGPGTAWQNSLQTCDLIENVHACKH